MASDLVELVGRLESGELHPRAALEQALERLERVEPALNLISVPMVDRARDVANRPFAAPFLGAPFLLKDAATAALPGVRQPLGSRLFREHTPERPSHLARQVLGAGLNPFGKTTTPEFSVLIDTYSTLNGVTRNPWDLSRSPGGSSGGSAAAVAARVVPAAHANDGAGSIRLPASFCGLVGLKPTRGRISLGPAIGEALGGTACEGVVSVTVRDTAALLAALSGAQPGDPYSASPLPADLTGATTRPPKKLRIALVLESPFDGRRSEDGSAAALAAAGLCEDLGHEVVPMSLPIEPEQLSTRYRRFYPTNCNRTIYAAMQARPDEDVLAQLDDFELWFWEEYGAIPAMQLVETLGYFNRMSRDIAEWMLREQIDLWLSPTTAGAAPPIGHLDASLHGGREVFDRFLTLNPFTPIANLTGAPSISLPLHWTLDGLPVGAQFTGLQGDEPLLLALAGQLETVRPWHERIPATCA